MIEQLVVATENQSGQIDPFPVFVQYKLSGTPFGDFEALQNALIFRNIGDQILRIIPDEGRCIIVVTGPCQLIFPFDGNHFPVSVRQERFIQILFIFLTSQDTSYCMAVLGDRPDPEDLFDRIFVSFCIYSGLASTLSFSYIKPKQRGACKTLSAESFVKVKGLTIP